MKKSPVKSNGFVRKHLKSVGSIVFLSVIAGGLHAEDLRESSLMSLEPEAYTGYQEERQAIRSDRLIYGSDIVVETQSLIDNAPWVLSADQTPSLLTHNGFLEGGRMYVRVPSESEIKLMLPGQIMDVIDRARFQSTKYLQDSMAKGMQERREQLEIVMRWVEDTFQKLSKVPSAEWPQYQFAKESREVALAYKSGVSSQSEGKVESILEEAQELITTLNNLMPHIPSENARNALYAVMVGIKDNAELLDKSMAQRDELVIKELDRMLARVKEVPRPFRDPPTKEQSPMGGGWVEEIEYSPAFQKKEVVRRDRHQALSKLDEGIEPPVWEPTEPLTFEVRETSMEIKSSAAVKEEEESWSIMGYLMIFFAGLGVFGYLKKLKRRPSLS